MVLKALTATILLAPCAIGNNWDYKNQGEQWGALCSGRKQSPIDIKPVDVVKSDLQVRLHYKVWNHDDVLPQEGNNTVPRIVFKPGRSPGKIQVGTGYSDFDEYELTSLEIHAPSEHTFRHASWPVELQLWHDPVPFLRMSEFTEHVVDLTKCGSKIDDKLNEIEKIEEKLFKQTRGQSSPWEIVGKADLQESVDWIDATKQEIESKLVYLRDKTSRQLQQAIDLANEADEIVAAQQRRFATHKVAISLFIMRAPPVFMGNHNESASQLIQWVTSAMAASYHTRSVLDANGIFAKANHLYAYNGSLTRPPCTRDVRWFVIPDPLAASVEDLEYLLVATRLSSSIANTFVGDAREVQSISAGMQVQQATLLKERFAEPALLPPNMFSEGMQKWTFVHRYCKVFFMCAIFLLCTPCLFWLIKIFNCSEDEIDNVEDDRAKADEDEEVSSDMGVTGWCGMEPKEPLHSLDEG